jgi:hypothetical protein
VKKVEEPGLASLGSVPSTKVVRNMDWGVSAGVLKAWRKHLAEKHEGGRVEPNQETLITAEGSSEGEKEVVGTVHETARVKSMETLTPGSGKTHRADEPISPSRGPSCSVSEERASIARTEAFLLHTKPKPLNGFCVGLCELYAGSSAVATALVLLGFRLTSLRAVEFSARQRSIGIHNLGLLHERYPDRVSLEVVRSMHLVHAAQDVRDLRACDLLSFDLITAGFPCTDMSRANKHRTGFKGTRSGQYYQLEVLLKRVVKLNPYVTVLLENVDFSDTFPIDYARVNAAWGPGVRRDSADNSWQHRSRVWWAYGMTVLPSVPKLGLKLVDCLEPEHTPIIAQYTDKSPFSCYNVKGVPQSRFVTQLTRCDTYNVRSGDALVYNSETNQRVRPNTQELARMAGWPEGMVGGIIDDLESPEHGNPITPTDKVFCLGNSQDLNEVRDILVDWRPRVRPNTNLNPMDDEGELVQSRQEILHPTEKPGTLQVAESMEAAKGGQEQGQMHGEGSRSQGGTKHSGSENIHVGQFDTPNTFSALNDFVDSVDWDAPSGKDEASFETPSCFQGAQGEMLRRCAAEIKKWFPRKGFSTHPPVSPKACLTAADWKHFLALKMPYVMHIPVPKMMSWKCKAEWNAVSLKRLRFHGSKEHYLVLRDEDNQRRVLVLHVPPRGMTEAQQQAHAERQATFHDNAQGVLEKGIRIKLNNWRHLDISDVQMTRLESGQELLLQYTPVQCEKKNYESSWEWSGMTRTELLRYRERGWIEGPLHYKPWLVMPLGAVFIPEKNKYRLVLDATASGLNPAMVKLWCRYDMVDDVLPQLKPDDWLSKLDFGDAFFHWAVRQPDCDLQGLRCPDTGEYYRFRFSYFGGSQAPAVQQNWTATIKALVNVHGLKYCEDGVMTDYDSFSMVGGFVDDCMCRHDSTLTKTQADSQFESVVKFLTEDLGIEVKRSKDVLPTVTADYTGVVIDTARQVAYIDEARRDKYRAKITDFLNQHKAGDKVNRRELSSIIGRLQWAAQVMPGSQLRLTRAYWCRDLLVDKGLSEKTTKQQWGKHVEVLLTDEAVEDLTWWADTLSSENATQLYLSRHPLSSGFWKGLVDEDDIFLDKHSITKEGINVFTTDASGYGGGGWWKHHRVHKVYTKSDGPLFRSSNWREMDMVKCSVERWGELWRGQRVLVRCDNGVTVSSINKGRVKVTTLYPLFRELQAVCRRYDIHLAARHIPGIANGLADRISRWKPSRDESDWQLKPELVDKYAKMTRPFDVDACADPLGKNAHCERYWSSVDDCLDQDWSHLHTWCNPAFDRISEILDHFKACFLRSPYDTSAVFCLPVWFTQKYWRKLAGFKLLELHPGGSNIYTSPNYWEQSDNEAYPANRVARGATKWPTCIAYHPSASAPFVSDRHRGRKSRHGACATGSGQGFDTRSLPVLFGDPARDALLLC